MTDDKCGWDKFRPYQSGDLSRVWKDLREDDRREMVAGGFTDPVLIEALLKDKTSQVLTWDTELGPVSIVGATRTGNPDIGLVWAIASSKAQPRWRFAVRNTERVLSELGQGYKVLTNFKDTRNQTQINWLRKIGCTFINTHEGADGNTFLEFVRIVK